MDGPNVYQYAQNHPIGASDPTGTLTWFEEKLDAIVNPTNPIAKGIVDNLAKRGEALVNAPAVIKKVVEEKGLTGLAVETAKGVGGLVKETGEALGDIAYETANFEGDKSLEKISDRATDVVLNGADLFTLGAGGVGAAKGVASGVSKLKNTSTAAKATVAAEAAAETGSATAKTGAKSTGAADDLAKAATKPAKPAAEAPSRPAGSGEAKQAAQAREAGTAGGEKSVKQILEGAGTDVAPAQPKRPIIAQETPSTCVSAACRMVAAEAGVALPEEALAKALGTTDAGANVLDAAKVLDDFGVPGGVAEGSASVATLQEGLQSGKSAIVGLEVPGFGRHAVVLDELAGGRAFIRDPFPVGVGSSFSLSIKDFQFVFSGRAVTFK